MNSTPISMQPTSSHWGLSYGGLSCGKLDLFVCGDHPIRKKPAAAVARESSSAAARLPQATPNKRHMDMSLVTGRPARAWSADRAGRHFSDDVLSLRMTSVIALSSTHG